MAKAPVTIERQKDGRHAVMDANGQTLGMHKSVFSAARQLHDYFGPAQGDIHPPVPQPKIPRPPKTQKPKPDAPSIPRP